MSGSESKYECYDVRMSYQAGYDQYEEWSSGQTIHSGVGWFHPFGSSSYFATLDCEEAKQFPIEQHFTEDWMEKFDTALFCIYRLPDGDIYAYDGILCVRGRGTGVGDVEISHGFDYIRRDVLTNIIVGGTGRYEGAFGIMTGTAEGGGRLKEVKGMTLPEALLKVLSGYIKLPI